jgi:hypothetical protein
MVARPPREGAPAVPRNGPATERESAFTGGRYSEPGHRSTGLSFVAADSPWHIFGGTSEASPIFSGIVALADQVAHRRLGDIHAALRLGRSGNNACPIGGR